MTKKRAKVISFINMKGGVGKTTLSVNVGYILSKFFGKRVLVIDIDPQMNATQYTLDTTQIREILENPNRSIYGILKDEIGLPSVVKTKYNEEVSPLFEIEENFYVIPSHLAIMNINLGDSPYRLRSYINENLKDKFDVIIIDSPPTISAYTKASLLASNYYVVPIKPDFLSLFGLPLLESYIERLKKEFVAELEFVGIILNMVQPTHRIYAMVKSKIEEKWGKYLFNPELKYKTIIARALSPEERDRRSHYIINLEDNELKTQMMNITEELIKRIRL